jgi:hypothetical protein
LWGSRLGCRAGGREFRNPESQIRNGRVGGNPKSEIPNPNWAGGRKFLIPNSSFLIQLCSSSNFSRTFAAWPFALTFFQWWATRPSGSMITVERMTPTVVLPYMLFSPQAP